MLKKVVSAFTVCAILFSFSVTAFAADSAQAGITSQFMICRGEGTRDVSLRARVLPNAEPCYEDAAISRLALSIDVTVQTPLESSWRTKYSSDYFYQANRIVERIDDFLYNEFGIDFYVSSQPFWTTTLTYADDIFENVMNTHGKGTADLMIAFAGPITDEAEVYGIAYTNKPYALVFDYDYNQNCKSAQHEVGHTYGLAHCSQTCVMAPGWDDNWVLFDHLCAVDRYQWNNAKNKY